MKLSPVKTIFFDVGGVLLSNGWGHESRAEASQKFNLNPVEFEVLHQFIFNIYEIGSISLDDYLNTVVFNHSRSFSKEEFKNFMFSQSVELPDFLKWLIEWKRDCGFSVFALNNEGKELNAYRIEKFQLEYWDGKEWKKATEGTTVGYKRLLQFPEVSTNKVRLQIESSRLNPTLSEIGLYNEMNP